jgi:hypothetical protein
LRAGQSPQSRGRQVALAVWRHHHQRTSAQSHTAAQFGGHIAARLIEPRQRPDARALQSRGQHPPRHRAGLVVVEAEFELVGSLIAGQQRGLANRDGFPAIKGLGTGESDDGLIQQRWEAGVQWQVGPVAVKGGGQKSYLAAAQGVQRQRRGTVRVGGDDRGR